MAESSATRGCTSTYRDLQALMIAATGAVLLAYHLFFPSLGLAQATSRWSQVYDHSGMRDYGTDIAKDAAGNLYVSAVTFTGSDTDYNVPGNLLLLKYDTEGNLVFSRTKDVYPGRSDWADHVEIDAFGNVYVAGHQYDRGIFVTKFDRLGNEVWTRTGHGSVLYDFRVDPIGNAVLAGSGNGDSDWLVRYYSADGNQVWEDYSNSPGTDRAYSIAFDPGGDVIVSGQWAGNQVKVVGGSASTGTGSPEWSYTKSVSGISWPHLPRIAVGPTGAIYVASGPGLLESLNSNGSVGWSRSLSFQPTDVEVGANGHVWATGRTNASDVIGVYACDPTGQALIDTTQAFSSPGNSHLGGMIAVDPSGGVAISGRTFLTSTSTSIYHDPFFFKMSDSGEIEYSVTNFSLGYDNEKDFGSMTFGDDGTLFVTGNLGDYWTSDVKTAAYEIQQSPAPDGEVVFHDSNLEAAVRSTLGIFEPLPVTETDMLSLTTLWAKDLGITSLEGLQYASNLQELTIWGNEVSDLAPLSGLTNLTTLWAYDNQISDLAPLSGLTNLRVLALAGNQISDVSPLSNLTQLTTLWFGVKLYAGTPQEVDYVNQVSDLTPLSGLTALVNFGVKGNPVSDISVLASMPDLTYLVISDTDVSDISVLSGCPQMQQLVMSNARVIDVSPLAGLGSLNRVLANGNQIEDVSALVSNTGIGEGDEVRLADNYLDLTPGSGDRADIDALLARGVNLTYEPQKTTAAPYTTVIPSTGIRLDFESVTSGGTSSATISSGRTAPANFRIVRGGYYDITTTATFTGYVDITIPYDESDLQGVNESNLKLMHWKSNGWEDITVSVDTVNNTITGRTDSFSPFAVMAPTSGGSVVSTPASSPWSIALLGLLSIGFVGWGRRRRQLSQ